MVLVQWQGMSPDNTSWESWDKLKVEYHLEDKVLLEGQRDVMTEINQQQCTQQAGTSNIRQQSDKVLDMNQRPKRKITKPQHLKDFV